MTDPVFEAAEAAIYNGDVKSLEQLLRQGLSVNAVDSDGRSLLMLAILASQASANIVQLLLENGAQVNQHDSGQLWTPLHFAARDHRSDLVRLLLDAGADVDAEDVFGNTPLWRATMTFHGDLSVIRQLIMRGANSKKPNKRGISSFEIAAGKIGLTDALREISGFS